MRNKKQLNKTDMPRKEKRVSNKVYKDQVRKSLEWKRLRYTCVDEYENKDCVTNRPLLPGFNVHHLDGRAENYGRLDVERFRPLNRNTHQAVHWLFTYTKKTLLY